MPKLHIYKNEKETCNAFAEWFTELVTNTLKLQGRFTVALSGGDTPKQFYKILAAKYVNKIDWSRLHVFWGDEKFVSSPFDISNANMAEKTLFEHVPIPKEQIHIIRTDITPQDSIGQYERLLHQYFDDGKTTFDLAILGIGKNGNTLSLFPGNDENNEKKAWVIPVYNKEEDLYRITLTSPIINASDVKAFLITGKSKQDAVENALKGKYDPEKYPAQLIQPAYKSVHWFLDEGAAGKLMRLTP
ncbi:MAG: 6-phosphogluconolactonase [Segetibacter sp.]